MKKGNFFYAKIQYFMRGVLYMILCLALCAAQSPAWTVQAGE